ncbi:MAG: hypothetical protein IKR76_09975 [Ruminococcus sp.]|nr:hypothetical protein [Ruminococcus sp.]
MKLRKNATVEEQYRSICKYIYGYALGGEAILGILSAAMLVSLVGQLVGGSFGDMFKGDDGIWQTVYYTYYVLLFTAAVNFLRVTFKKLTSSDSPFRTEIAKGMRVLSRILVLGGAGSMILSPVLNRINPNVGAHGFDLFGFGIGIAGLMFDAFSLIFEYGCSLQQQADETL